MNKETITDSLEKLLMAIHKQVVVIRDTDEQIPKIEMDKTLSNIRSLYEQFTVLNYLNSHPPEKKTTEESISIPQNKPAEAVKEIEPPFVPIAEKQIERTSFQPIEQPIAPAEIIKPVEPIIEKVIQAPVQPEKIEPEIQKQPIAEPIQPIYQAPAKEEKQTQGEPQRLGDKLRTQKLENLHSAVTLSDKFLYMNELFEGENNMYKEAMDMLNRLTSKADADHYMDSLAARYKWYEREKTEKKFRELVARKF